jgi:hypothetical protein
VAELQPAKTSEDNEACRAVILNVSVGKERPIGDIPPTFCSEPGRCNATGRLKKKPTQARPGLPNASKPGIKAIAQRRQLALELLMHLTSDFSTV